MSARARRLTCAGLAAAAVTLAGCGSSSHSNPTPTPSGTHTTPVSPTPSATPVLVGTTRTVLSPLGLRIHSAPALGSSNVVGDAAEGATFSVLQYQSGGGGWFRVQGRSVTGWIVADPTLTAQGTFNAYQSADGNALLYPQDWAFQQESYGAIFLPQQGKQNIVLETGTTLASFGQPGLAGYTQAMSGSVVVCGYTGTLTQYVKNPSYTGRNADAAAGAAPAAVRGDPAQVRHLACDVDRIRLREQQPARCVRGSVQLDHVSIPALRADLDPRTLTGAKPVRDWSCWLSPGR